MRIKSSSRLFFVQQKFRRLLLLTTSIHFIITSFTPLSSVCGVGLEAVIGN